MSFDGARLYLKLLCLHTAHTFLYYFLSVNDFFLEIDMVIAIFCNTHNEVVNILVVTCYMCQLIHVYCFMQTTELF